MSPKIGRNDICSCGSGKKYKNCCAKGGFHLSRKANQMLFGGVLLIAIIAIGVGYMNVGDLSAENESSSEVNNPSTESSVTPPVDIKSSTNRTITPQPLGDVPPGKVWSAEHGHWHDDNPNVAVESGTKENPIYISGDENITIDPRELIKQQQSLPAATQQKAPGELTPQPPGTAPPGKVWSGEHGHWHDATRPSPAYNDIPSLTPPPGPAPPGKTWSAEHGHWHGPPTEDEMVASGINAPAIPNKAPYNTKKNDDNNKTDD